MQRMNVRPAHLSLPGIVAAALRLAVFGALAGCANTVGAALPDSATQSGDTPGAGADAAAAVDPDDLDLLAPAGVCEKPEEWFYLGNVLDGDTITIDDGYWNKVRLLGVAAPEIAHNPKPAECYGLKAWQAVKAWLPEGQGVKLCARPDPGADDKDDYKRLLRYVYFKDAKGRVVQLNARVIRRGQGRLYRAFAKGLTLEAEYQAREAAAQAEQLGGWKECAWTPL